MQSEGRFSLIWLELRRGFPVGYKEGIILLLLLFLLSVFSVPFCCTDICRAEGTERWTLEMEVKRWKRKYTRQEARSMGCLSWGLFSKGPLFRLFFWRGNFAAFYCWFLHRDEGCCWPQISPFFFFPDALLEVFMWTIFNLSTAPSCSSLFISGKHLRQSLRSGSPAPSCAFVDLPVKMLSAYYCWRPVYDGYECLQLLEQNGGFGNSAAQPPMQIQNLHNNAGNVCFQTVFFWF